MKALIAAFWFVRTGVTWAGVPAKVPPILGQLAFENAPLIFPFISSLGDFGMLIMEPIAKIRLSYFIECKSIKQIFRAM